MRKRSPAQLLAYFALALLPLSMVAPMDGSPVTVVNCTTQITTTLSVSTTTTASVSQTSTTSTTSAGATTTTSGSAATTVNCTTSTTTTTSTITGPRLLIHVTDQSGVPYAGVLVEIYQSPSKLVANGTTSQGAFYSPALAANQTYNVIVYTPTGLTGQQGVYVGTNDVSLNVVVTRPSPPLVVVSGVQLSSSAIHPGDTFGMKITISNQGSQTASTTSLALRVSSPLSLSGNVSSAALGEVAAGGSRTFNVPISVTYQAKPGAYQMGYVVNFTDPSNNQYSSSGNIDVVVVGNPVQPNLIISSVIFSPPTPSPGGLFHTSLVVSNVGTADAFNGLLSLSVPAPLSVIGSAATIQLGSVAAGNTRTLNLSTYVPSTATVASFPINFVISYQDKLGTLYNQTGTYSVVLFSNPRVLIQQVIFGASVLNPGIGTTLNVGLLNGGGDSALNVTLTWSGQTPLVPKQTRYIGVLAAGRAVNASFGLTIPSSTSPGQYATNLTLSYNDPRAVHYDTTITYPLQIQPIVVPQLTITNTLVNPPVLSPGTQGTFTVFVKNLGNSTVNNVVVSIPNGTQFFSSSRFGIGDMQPGAQTTAVVGMSVSQTIRPGTYNLSVDANYSDLSGASHVNSIPIELTVYPSTSLLSSSILTSAPLWIGVVGVVVALIALISFRRYRRG